MVFVECRECAPRREVDVVWVLVNVYYEGRGGKKVNAILVQRAVD